MVGRWFGTYWYCYDGIRPSSSKIHADQLARMCFEAKGYTIVQIPKGKTWATCTIEERKAVIRQLNLPVDEELCQSCTSLPEYWNRVVSKKFSAEHLRGPQPPEARHELPQQTKKFRRHLIFSESIFYPNEIISKFYLKQAEACLGNDTFSWTKSGLRSPSISRQGGFEREKRINKFGKDDPGINKKGMGAG